MRKPLIAIPAYHLASDRVARWPQGGYGVPDPYVDALHRAGGLPVIIPEGDGGDPEEILARFDGLLLVGGGDVEPSAYGAQPGSTLYGLEPDRDRLEIDLLLTADERRMPALAICRGAQVMNVAFGGTLHQHLPDVGGLIEHGIPLAGTVARHPVTLAAESRAQAASGASTLSCSSHHHQGIAELGDGLVATGWSEDGLVEAIERETGWILGVQWHPEDTASDIPAQQAFFSELVARAANRSG